MNSDTSRRQFLSVLGALVALGACGRGVRSGLAADPQSGPTTPSTTPPAPSPLADAGTAHLAFAAELYRTVAASMPGNLALSPYSVASALAMTRNGAAGKTAEEMDKVLRAGPLEALNADYAGLEAALAGRARQKSIPGGDPVLVELATANRLFGDKATTFREDFLDRLADRFKAPIERVDYRHDFEGARKVINSWVSERTKERIPNLIPPGILDDYTRLVLTNAIYFKAPWAVPFRPEATQSAFFNRQDGSPVSVPFMTGQLNGWYAAGDGWQAVELPYAGAELAMTVVLPEGGGFSAFNRGLSGERLAEITGALKPSEVDLRLPRWTFRTQARLKEVLQAMGMATAFDERKADLSGMTQEERLFIAAVVHEAFVAVDEAGTEAAAATAVGVSASSARPTPQSMTVDRPFLFLIRDRPTGEVLFLGRVVDPSQT
jgi:serpin B